MQALIGSIRAALGAQEEQLEELRTDGRSVEESIAKTDRHCEELRAELLSVQVEVVRLQSVCSAHRATKDHQKDLEEERETLKVRLLLPLTLRLCCLFQPAVLSGFVLVKIFTVASETHFGDRDYLTLQEGISETRLRTQALASSFETASERFQERFCRAEVQRAADAQAAAQNELNSAAQNAQAELAALTAEQAQAQQRIEEMKGVVCSVSATVAGSVATSGSNGRCMIP